MIVFYGLTIIGLMMFYLYRLRSYPLKEVSLICLTLGLSFALRPMDDYLYSLVFLTISYVDLKEHIIPNNLLMMLIAYWFFKSSAWKDIHLGLSYYNLMGLVILLSLFLLSLISGHFGMGDVKLLASILLIYGSLDFLSILFVSMLILFLYALANFLLLKKSKSQLIAYAPFVYISILLLGV